MTDTRQKVLKQIDANKDKSIKFLQKMVSIPSVTGDEGAIQKFLADYLTKMGLEVDMWETDWEALKKHPGYHSRRPWIRGTPEYRRNLERDGRGQVVATQRPYRRHSGRQRGRLERQSLVGVDQGRQALWPRIVRHEERRRQPHHGGRIT